MKVELDELRLGISAMLQECQIGIPDKKNPNLWKHKKEIHNDFLHAVVTCWENKKQTIRREGYSYEISVKKTKIKPRKTAKK